MLEAPPVVQYGARGNKLNPGVGAESQSKMRSTPGIARTPTLRES
jgi:hypothetical protein